MKTTLAVLAAALVASPIVLAGGGDASVAAKRTAKPVLARFTSCGALIRYARKHDTARYERSIGAGPLPPMTGGPVMEDRGAAPQAQTGPVAGGDDSSRTNVQEAGVDEPDFVKTDGRRIYALSNGILHVVDGRSDKPRLLGSLKLESYGTELLIRGDRLLVVSSAGSFYPMPVDQPASGPVAGSAMTVAPGWYQPKTVLTEVDVSDPAAMKVVRTQEIDGNYVSARQTGETARLVITSPARAVYSDDPVLERRVTGWVPRTRFRSRVSGRKSTRVVSACRKVRRSRVFSGLDMLTVLTVDMGRGLPSVEADSLMTNGQTVYASTKALYVATERWLPNAANPETQPPSTSTAIHKFDASRDNVTAYEASGFVRGFVLNQFSMSEHDGRLRVATTETPLWWGGAPREESESFVSVLEQRGSDLAEVGRVGGLGRGERIYSVRFIGDRGYVVTFRQTDPLYTIDLSNPQAPRVRGELKILGYSAYLHPISDDLLIGVGQDATEQGRTLGTQVSLFDVSDPANPRRLHSARVAGEYSSSEAEHDHHAFLWWPDTNLAVIPVSVYEDDRSFSGAIGFRVGRSGIEEVGRASHDQYGIRRSLVIGESLFTVSDAGVEQGNLLTLAEQGFAAFPPPEPPPAPDQPSGGGGGSEPAKPSPAIR